MLKNLGKFIVYTDCVGAWSFSINSALVKEAITNKRKTTLRTTIYDNVMVMTIEIGQINLGSYRELVKTIKG